MGNRKSTGLFKLSITNLNIRMRVAGRYLGSSKMLLEPGDKMKTKLPSRIKMSEYHNKW